MDVVFCGSPQFAVPMLEALVREGFRVRLVVTQPDRPSGRGQSLSAPPIKVKARALDFPIAQPEKIKNNEAFRAQLAELAPQAIVVVGYGRIIPKWMIDLPPLGNINVHASLLPKYRGAAPIQWAIASGEIITGITIMRIDEGLDTGDILLRCEIPIEPADTAVTLAPRLANLGGELLVEALRGLEAGRIQPRSQDHSKATLAPMLKKEDGLIDFQWTAATILNRLRGFQPWPGAYTNFRGKNLLIHRASVLAVEQALPAATMLVRQDRLLVGAGEGSALEIFELQLEGKKRVSAADFIHGHQPKPGERLG